MTHFVQPKVQRLKKVIIWGSRRLAFWSRAPWRWRAALESEKDYWDASLRDYIGKTGGRLDPASELAPHLKELLGTIKAGARILDVGAGPLTVLGKCWDGQRLDITATDPLAGQYDAMLAKYRIIPPVRTLRCDGERLVESFGENRFDLAHAQNSIDHSYDPLKVIQQMVAVVKPGGWIVLEHHLHEAENQRYQGLHQWNLDLQENRFTLWKPGCVIDVDRALSPGASVVQAYRLPDRWYQGILEDTWFRVVLRKTDR